MCQIMIKCNDYAKGDQSDMKYDLQMALLKKDSIKDSSGGY